MSRHGYCDDIDDNAWGTICWRGAVASAIKGKRGQAFLRELAAAMDTMPVKRLIRCDLRDSDGEVCALGTVGAARGIDMTAIDPEERDVVAKTFGIAEAMAAEIMYENDEGVWKETPEQRWQRVRKWVSRQLIEAQPHTPTAKE